MSKSNDQVALVNPYKQIDEPKQSPAYEPQIGTIKIEAKVSEAMNSIPARESQRTDRLNAEFDNYAALLDNNDGAMDLSDMTGQSSGRSTIVPKQ